MMPMIQHNYCATLARSRKWTLQMVERQNK